MLDFADWLAELQQLDRAYHSGQRRSAFVDVAAELVLAVEQREQHSLVGLSGMGHFERSGHALGPRTVLAAALVDQQAKSDFLSQSAMLADQVAQPSPQAPSVAGVKNEHFAEYCPTKEHTRTGPANVLVAKKLRAPWLALAASVFCCARRMSVITSHHCHISQAGVRSG